MKKLAKINNNFNAIDIEVKRYNEAKVTGIREALTYLENEIDTLKDNYGINNRKSVKAIRDILFGDVNEINKTTKRVFTVALHIIAKGVEIKHELLSISQIENLLKYGTKTKINELSKIADGATYVSDVADYLKSLKTRKVEVKAFPRLKK